MTRELLTLIALAVVFLLQQYGGTGAAETFGAGGIADYAGLFLAGVASEAITGGLRAVKLR
jgi:preprotein translocase subunit SecG